MTNKSNFYPKKVYVSGYRWGSFNSFVERMIKAHIYTVASLLFFDGEACKKSIQLAHGVFVHPTLSPQRFSPLAVNDSTQFWW